MKKTLSIVLALVLVLALMAGCGNKNDSSEPPEIEARAAVLDEGPSDDWAGAIGWPTESLPEGFPPYPDGEVVNVDGQSDDGIGITIGISETGEATFETYMETLESEGWEAQPENELGLVYLENGAIVLWIGFFEPGDVLMYVIDYDYNVQDWPTAILPPGFPAYPDGKVTYSDASEEGDFVYVEISETDEDAFEAYLVTLKSAAWTETQKDDFGVEMEKDKYWLSLFFDSSGMVSLGVMYIDLGLDYEWPEDLLPYDLPEYPDGNLVYVNMNPDGSVTITVEDTSPATLEEYIGSMAEAGWTVTSVDNINGEDVFLVYLLDYEDGLWTCSVDLTDSSRVGIRCLPREE